MPGFFFHSAGAAFLFTAGNCGRVHHSGLLNAEPGGFYLHMKPHMDRVAVQIVENIPEEECLKQSTGK